MLARHVSDLTGPSEDKKLNHKKLCVSCWTAYILQDDTQSLQYRVIKLVVEVSSLCLSFLFQSCYLYSEIRCQYSVIYDSGFGKIYKNCKERPLCFKHKSLCVQNSAKH